jgi:hypothetical protein
VLKGNGSGWLRWLLKQVEGIQGQPNHRDKRCDLRLNLLDMLLSTHPRNLGAFNISERKSSALYAICGEGVSIALPSCHKKKGKEYHSYHGQVLRKIGWECCS